MKRIPNEVQEVCRTCADVYDHNNRLWANDYVGAAKLWVEIQSEVRRVFVDETMRRRFIRGIVQWGVFDKGFIFRNLYNKVFDYLSVFELDEHKERYVREFIIAYTEYVAQRWNERLNIGINPIVTEAARNAKKLCKEWNITFYEYVKRQHECWDKIQRPLSLTALADERRCIKRYQVSTDADKRRGTVRREDYKQGHVARKWKEVMTIGPKRYLEKASSMGFLAYVAKMYVEDSDSGCSQEILKHRYSVEKVEEVWKNVVGTITL